MSGGLNIAPFRHLYIILPAKMSVFREKGKCLSWFCVQLASVLNYSASRVLDSNVIFDWPIKELLSKTWHLYAKWASLGKAERLDTDRSICELTIFLNAIFVNKMVWADHLQDRNIYKISRAKFRDSTVFLIFVNANGFLPIQYVIPWSINTWLDECFHYPTCQSVW